MSKTKDEAKRNHFSFQKSFRRESASPIIENTSDRKPTDDVLWTSVSALGGLTTFDAIHDAICLVDLDGKILRCNQAMIKLLGKLQKEIIGRTIWELMFGKPESIEDCPMARMLKTRSRETKVLAKDDHWLQITVDPLTDEHNNLIGGIQIISDITERKQAEEEIRRLNLELKEKLEERTKELKQTYEKLSAAKERFYQAQKMESIGMVAGGVAHDFNNFLTTILGNIAIAKMSLIPEDRIFKTLTKAEKAALQAEDIAQQLLVFSSGGKSVKKVVAIKELIKDSVSFALRGSTVKCEFSIPEDTWSIEVDEKQIRQVIYSLITNAKQAMPEGGTIKVHCENVTIGAEDHPPLTAGEYIKLLITDQGIGIPKENLAKIFEPFFTTKPNQSGFGLANAYFIIQKHSGYIDVESEEAVGTTFDIYLPAVDKVIIQAVPEKSKTGKTIESTEIIIPSDVTATTQTFKGKILVMDDGTDVRDTLGAILNIFGYTVEAVHDGAKAIELYKKAKEDGKPFDGVILDLTIPGGMGGKETIKRLLEIDPNVKAIVSSGYSDDPVMADFRKYGFSGSVPKPYSIDELIKTTGKAVNGITEISSTVFHYGQPPKPLP